MHDLGLINGKVYIDGTFKKTNVYVKDGVISAIAEDLQDSKDIYDCLGNLVIPGIIDPHTHFDLDLGLIKSQDDFKSGTKAAAFGGVTTIIDFLSPVDNPKELRKAFNERKWQAKDSVIDYKFHACLKNPKGHVLEIVNALKNYGLNTVKVFTTYSDSGRRTYEEEIKELLVYSKTHDFTLTVHVENDDLIVINDTDGYDKLPINRPTESELSEAVKLAELVRETKGYLYMVHLSSGDTLRRLKNDYNDILNTHFFVESCPHYFTFNKDILKTEKGYLYTMAPPLRSDEEVTELKNHIDYVYTIGTDHCPFNKNDKNKPFLKDIPLGIGGVESSFRIMFSMFGDAIIPKMTENVAKAHKLYPQKGVIKVGSDADMFVYQLKDTTISTYHNATDYNVYLNTPVNGEVISTLSRGSFVVKNQVYYKQLGQLLNRQGGQHEGH